ncbi:hypothetical protein AAX05_08760 [Moraxella bovoculi]|uniref:Uncharacterized protein n=1 Tax=Moraxella bovoculi TaxID=386891 RepID=A0AAC8T7G4_9GAMM|nr:hypothetical protein [Moraxella bovoculi]AKG07175.1 hypothetical protein AAX06_02195 [Moraxella bovoculi]AKG10218.1 hypothetical protein AAX05_08760 [Moraxella bovoculi]AKG12140.1 hypothetical protein AAX07_09305 [Moraxella bovoculi]AKG14109.1 hypothetical protein AAX11_08850 [Moraxella bovoculi]
MQTIEQLPLIDCPLISRDDWLLMSQHSQAAYLSALVRKVRQLSAFECLKIISKNESLDMTTLLAVRLGKGIWGINFPNTLLSELFATKGRNASNKSKDFDRVDDIIERYCDACQGYTSDCIAHCKDNYTKVFKIAKKGN